MSYLVAKSRYRFKLILRKLHKFQLHYLNLSTCSPYRRYFLPDRCWRWQTCRSMWQCFQSSSVSCFSSLCLCPSRLPLWGGLHRGVGLVQDTGPNAGRSEQPVGTAYVCHCNLSHGESESLAPGPALPNASPADSLHLIYLLLGVQLGGGPDISGCLSLGLLKF